MCVCVTLHTRARVNFSVYLAHFSTHLPRPRLSLEGSAVWIICLLVCPRGSLLPIPQALGLQRTTMSTEHLYGWWMGAGNLNCGPQACSLHDITVSSETSPQPKIRYLLATNLWFKKNSPTNVHGPYFSPFPSRVLFCFNLAIIVKDSSNF